MATQMGPGQPGSVRKWLVVISDTSPTARIEIPPAGLVLGRAVPPPGKLANDPQVSASHARIARAADGRLVISDLGSTNGTFVNGIRIGAPQPVRQGDTIQLGQTMLRVEEGADRQATAFGHPGPAAAGGAWVAPPDEPVPAAERSFRAPPDPLPVPPGSGQPARIPNDGGQVGQVRGFQARTESYGQGQQRTIWSFRLERYDDSGNLVLLLPVEMRALWLRGSIADGDWACVHGKRHRGTLRASRLENLSTGATVEATGAAKSIQTVGIVLAILFFTALAVFAVFIIHTIASSPH
jgi:hypothetical protein